MANVSVEDFQLYHNDDFSHSATPPRQFSRLPRENDEPSDSFTSPSLTAEDDSPNNEPVFDLASHVSSPDTSPQHSDDEISVLLSDYHHSRPVSQQHVSSIQHRPSSPFTPIKLRPSGFRNPSSVRALQDTTPPHCHLTSPLSTGSKDRNGSYFPTPSRKGTPRLRQRSPTRTSPSKKSAGKKEYPLVLLHVNLMPITDLYSNSVMEHVLPPYILSNWKLLREKATPTVLNRGILIPHPREDYDLLEERLLESLELRMPRILACGHFHLQADEEAELVAVGEEVDDEDNEVDICADCGRKILNGHHGAGVGKRKWDIKIYAANGLMRAGAWSAAWREMERIDVEIVPWIEEEMKRDLDLAREAEEQEDVLRRASEEDATQNPHIEQDLGREYMPASNGLDDARMREIYGDCTPKYPDGFGSPPSRAPSAARSASPHVTQRTSSEMPLSALLVNYLIILARDPRNIAIAVLSLMVLLLAVLSRPGGKPVNVVPSLVDTIPQDPPMTRYATDGTWGESPITSTGVTSSSTIITDLVSAQQTGQSEQVEDIPRVDEQFESVFEMD